NTPKSDQNPALLNSQRHRGMRPSRRTIDTKARALVYLLRKPRPTSNPVIGQYQLPLGVRSSPSQSVNIDAAQKKIESGSMVITRFPMAKIGVTFSATTAQNPTAPPKRRRVK